MITLETLLSDVEVSYHFVYNYSTIIKEYVKILGLFKAIM